MFRNPREDASSKQSEAILPSTGRPPTPPTNGNPINNSPFFSPASSLLEMAKVQIHTSPTPILGRQAALRVPSGKKVGPKNQSILNFFGKADKTEIVDATPAESALFFDDKKPAVTPPAKRSVFTQWRPSPSTESEGARFNEDATPVKRRRYSAAGRDDHFRTPSPERSSPLRANVTSARKSQRTVQQIQRKSRGGFVDDSSEDEEDAAQGECTPGVLDVEKELAGQKPTESQTTPSRLHEVVETIKVPLKPPDESETYNTTNTETKESPQLVPTLNHESTSAFAPCDFGEDDNFENDEFFEEGEEYLERKWMEEQRILEIGLEDDSKSESGTEGVETPGDISDGALTTTGTARENVVTCPICAGSMKALSDVAASSHVNACLDGTAAALPKVADEAGSTEVKRERSMTPHFAGSAKRFQRAGIARPAQANPFQNSETNKTGSSAFNRLMSGHAEDAAWAEAASNEAQSRGKPAYQRTCPFYKIMPGFYICVDAFRYGKVEGQNAYFLSHFHSDHYVGLTASWCHGPIYASKVTCNLMRQQLRVDSKWLRPLEFEKKVEVPDTKGVYVTMIPANHCPGSSLYLFEKVVRKDKDGSPKVNRVLHCGDFRACPAHIHHPLLMPDVVDSITGQTKEQVIDTCYLDTTYLTPKFSFPGQSDVIDACANMCVSLSKEIVDTEDSWEKVKLAKAGSAMKKFLEKGEEEKIKTEIDEVEERKTKPRGRLLVVIGTYSIGKERICLGIARALHSKVYAPPAKMRICKALEDADLNALLTTNPLEAQVHMQTLMEIRADTLHDYLITFKGHFHRVVGFRPTGWTYRPPASRFTDNPAISTVLNSDGWKSRFTMHDLTPQRGSTKAANCFGVPYSEHSSFRELTMFCCALRINRIVPTVNIGSAKSRERMKGWIEKWDAEKRKNGLYKVEKGAEGWGSGDGQLRYGV